jgi:transcriptional regulator with GAF, ATPase, and Fis domain
MSLINGPAEEATFSKGRIRPAVPEPMTDEARDVAEAMWRQYSRVLRREPAPASAEPPAGAAAETRAATSDDRLAIVPIFDDGGLVALLCLDGRAAVLPQKRELAETVSRLVSRALAAAAPPASDRPASVETFLERTSFADIGRQKLLVTLERNEWNIARVARLLGVTRKTVYARMQRFGILRERVPKIATRRGTAPTA